MAKRLQLRRENIALPCVVFLSAFSLLFCAESGAKEAAEWTPPQIELPKPLQHPTIACTAPELERLRVAYRGGGPEKRMVAEDVERADAAIKRPLVFPTRGGQHNQWYQCDKCQLALKTIDDTHHQCPRCKSVYSGPPYDDVIFARRHGANLRNMEAAAWAWAITGERRYAEFAAKALLGYAERYEKYPYHTNNPNRNTGRSGGHLAEQTLNESSMMARNIAPAYDLIYDSGVLSPADHESIRSGLILPMLRNIDRNKAGKSNWQTWHNAGMLKGGAVIGDVEWVQKAIADPKNGFLRQMEISVSGDGMWYENSWGYHYYTLSAMVEIVEAARRLGIDLWNHPTLKKMFTIPVEYAMPDGSLPRFGDDVHSTAGRAGSYLEYAFHTLRDPAMVPYLSRRPTWDSILLGRDIDSSVKAPPVQQKSRVFTSAGHAILRADGSAGQAAAITFGPYGGFHGHFDKLSFVYFVRGRELGVDPGRASSQAYRLPIHRDWYKATIGHNTVLVDGKSQQPAEGQLLDFASNDKYSLVWTECDAAYPGVQYRRVLCMTPEYLVVFDELASEQSHQYDWVYHNRGDSADCNAETRSGGWDRAMPGKEYFKNSRVGESDGNLKFRFSGNGVDTHLLFDSTQKSEFLIADGPCASILDRVPLVIVSRSGKVARFAAALEPVASGEGPTVSAVSLDASNGTTNIDVHRGGAMERLTILVGGEWQFTANGETRLRSTNRAP